MYTLLVRLMLLAALIELGISASDFRDCHGHACLAKFEKRSRDVLRIDWRPIAVFPKDSARFR